MVQENLGITCRYDMLITGLLKGFNKLFLLSSQLRISKCKFYGLRSKLLFLWLLGKHFQCTELCRKYRLKYEANIGLRQCFCPTCLFSVPFISLYTFTTCGDFNLIPKSSLFTSTNYECLVYIWPTMSLWRPYDA